jgi:hypothetical protein
MAYLGIDNFYSAPVARPAAVRPAVTAPAGFSALEWSVIALAKRDSIASLNTPSRMSRALGSLFGFGETSRLAEPRLEALRRVAVFAWRRGHALPMSEIGQFTAAGFTMAQVEALVASVTGEPRGQHSSQFRGNAAA